MRRIGASLILVVAACKFDSPADRFPDTPPGEVDAAPLPDVDPLQCWTPRAHPEAVPCELPAAPAWTVPGPVAVLNTTTGVLTVDGVVVVPGVPSTVVTQLQNPSISLRVISVEQLTVPAGVTLRAVGTHPLMLLSWSTIEVAGTIDVSSKRGVPLAEAGGAGAGRGGCQPGANGGGMANSSSGGGGGGFRDGGGDGGRAENPTTNGGNGGGSISEPTLIFGGCAGGFGGPNGTYPSGGTGGGAVQLTAKTRIHVTSTGVIHAGGMGGEGGQGGGGGGGGSGGFIGFDAGARSLSSGEVVIDAGARIAANGGGGGTGCDGGNNGDNGADGGIGTDRAAGGNGGCNDNVAGGGGGARAMQGGQQGQDANDGDGGGGGGGGGGVGYIFVWAQQTTFQGTASPQHQTRP